MKYNLVENMPYRVIHRTWDNSKTVKAKREFLFTENRFGSIPCYCFTSKLIKNKYPASLISIPEYDIISIVAIR